MARKPEAPTFSSETLDFLEELAANNNRDWFAQHKERYEAHVREPALAFIRAMAPRIEALAPNLVADDRKVGGSLMRIHKDTRFAKDKTPYKTNVGIQFRHRSAKDVHAPGLYVHVGLDGHFVGVGTWQPDAPSLAAIRKAIDERGDRFRAIIGEKRFAKTFERMGDAVKRPPKGYAADHPLIDELKRKSHIASVNLTTEQLLGPKLVEIVSGHLETARDYMRFICEALGETL